MGTNEIVDLIREFTARRCDERGLPMPQLHQETVLLGDAIGLDSVDLATLVFELQEATGYDPFEQGFIGFRTVGELAGLFESRCASAAAGGGSGAAVQ